MEEWKTYKLGELVEVKGGKRLPKGESLISKPTSHPYIRIRDLGTSRILNLNPSYEFLRLTCKTLCSSEYKFQPVEEEPNI